jgi:hypothetical protein
MSITILGFCCAEAGRDAARPRAAKVAVTTRVAFPMYFMNVLFFFSFLRKKLQRFLAGLDKKCGGAVLTIPFADADSN